jgi:hypothetical protein
MHVVVSWDIKSGSPSRWKVINEKLRDTLGPYSWVRALSTFYIVKLNSQDERKLLQEALTTSVKALPERVHFIISPVMIGGRYNGWLPKDMWEKVNKRLD